MKNLGLLTPFLYLIASCTSDSSIQPTTSLQTDTLQVNPDSILIVQAVQDGMYNELYIFSANEDSITADIREVHVVPEISGSGSLDSATVWEPMFGVVATDFEMYFSLFENFRGTVKFFYDANRTMLLTAYTVDHSEPTGPVQVFSPEGVVIISRIYEQGNCVNSIVDIYAIDWQFNPKKSALELEKFAAYKTTDADGNMRINLGESMHPNSGEFNNSLYELIQKPVFENTFTLNGQPFTGTLMGYERFNVSDPIDLDPYFELVFLEGKLHDTIRLYSEFGELALEEKFENGVLTETLYELDYSEMDGMAKPVIYLYPEKEQPVHVALDLYGTMTHSYPAYPDGGWNVLATQNGTLYDAAGRAYYALFWEGVSPREYSYTTGFVVAGAETATFLENSLSVLGLTDLEANEFIMYWLPQMENNPYNLIHFSTREYNEIARLEITPEPESLIRIMMVWSPLETKIDLPQQNLYDLRVERKGFTVVEWGGKRQVYQQAL